MITHNWLLCNVAFKSNDILHKNQRKTQQNRIFMRISHVFERKLQ